MQTFLASKSQLLQEVHLNHSVALEIVRKCTARILSKDITDWQRTAKHGDIFKLDYGYDNYLVAIDLKEITAKPPITDEPPNDIKHIKQIAIAPSTNCNEKCTFERSCANHVSAGDYRTEGGVTPKLTILPNGNVGCRTYYYECEDGESHETTPVNHTQEGCLILQDGVFILYEQKLFADELSRIDTDD